MRVCVSVNRDSARDGFVVAVKLTLSKSRESANPRRFTTFELCFWTKHVGRSVLSSAVCAGFVEFCF